MKTFIIFLSVAVLDGTNLLCEGNVRREIWPAPSRPDFFWAPNGPRESPGEPWLRPVRFDPPRRSQNDMWNDFVSGGGRNDRNNNRRTTAEDLGPITSTPRTVHTAPKGCTCPMTQEFNPVCGTDGNTYRNMGLLNCYVRCGANVFQKRLGTC